MKIRIQATSKVQYIYTQVSFHYFWHQYNEHLYDPLIWSRNFILMGKLRSEHWRKHLHGYNVKSKPQFYAQGVYSALPFQWSTISPGRYILRLTWFTYILKHSRQSYKWMGNIRYEILIVMMLNILCHAVW